MPHRQATPRALLAGVFTGLGGLLVVALLWLALSGGGAQAHDAQHIHGRVVLTVPNGGHVIVNLPAGWTASRLAPATIALASPRTCHTATLTAFLDHAAERPSLRAVHLLSYLSGREFDSGRLWRGTTAGGGGYAVYDPRALVGVEVTHAGGRTIAIVLHGLPAHGKHCSRHAAAAPRWELSRLLQDLRVPGSARLRLKALTHAKA